MVVRRLSLVALAACKFHAGAATSDGHADVPPDLTGTGETWDFDTANDFVRNGADAGAIGIEPWGSLTSPAYVPGGVIVHGINQLVWSSAQTDQQVSWTATSALTPDGTG